MEYKHKQIRSCRAELYQKAEEYIKHMHTSRGVYMREFYKEFGKPEEWIMKYFPEFKDWLEEQLLIHKNMYKKYAEIQFAEKARLIINKYRDEGKRVSRKAIAKELNALEGTVYRNPYIVKLIENPSLVI